MRVLRLTRVVNALEWFVSPRPSLFGGRFNRSILLRDIVPSPDLPVPKIDSRFNLDDYDWIPIVQYYATLRIGDIGSCWADTNERIAFKYAKILLADLFEFYTSPNGVLTLPTWSHLQFVLDEFLENALQFKYHPSRVRAFVEAYGVESLEAMSSLA